MSDVNDTPEVEEEEQPKKKTSRSKTTAVTWFFERGGYCLCAAGDVGYAIPSELCDTSQSLTFEIDLSDESIITLYDWEQEIEAMLPTRNEMKANIRRALWVNGAISKESAKTNHVQKNLMRGAFPYRIEINEENS